MGLNLDIQETLATIASRLVADRVGSERQSVSDKNTGFSVLKKLPKFLTGEHSAILEGIGPSNVLNYKYAPLASVDVERSFSAY